MTQLKKHFLTLRFFNESALHGNPVVPASAWCHLR